MKTIVAIVLLAAANVAFLMAGNAGANPGDLEALPPQPMRVLPVRVVDAPQAGHFCSPKLSLCSFLTTGGRDNWTFEVVGNLKRSALAGNTLFIFYDLDDPNSIAEHEVTALYQLPVKAGRALTARVSLSSDDGFRPGHPYRVQIAQLVGGKEIVLADGVISVPAQ